MRKLIIAATVSIGLSLSLSGASHAYFETGNTLYSSCQREPMSFFDGVCYGTILGAYDMMRAMGWSCNDDGVVRGQVRDVVVNYMQRRPEIRHEPAAWIVILAAQDAFACIYRPLTMP